MCGIAGCISRVSGALNYELKDAIDRQLATIHHRGPDSFGSFVMSNAGIGQTRLAIVDLVTGNPPITDESGTICAVLNGEIYNYQDLRKQLFTDGHRLATSGDTEVLVHMAESLDPIDLARRLEGMFAFAIYDDRRRRLILGRDRMGKKPLYYWQGNGQTVFGSEIKAVLAHPRVPRIFDSDVLPDYLRFGYVPTPRTFYQGIVSLPPGHIMVIEPHCEPRIERYWSSPLYSSLSIPNRRSVGANSSGGPSMAEASTKVRTLLTSAVERRLISDVPLGAFLSGGVDSSAVVALMAREMTSPVATFTIGFDDIEGFDERPFAAAVAKKYRTDHTEFVVKPDASELIEELVTHHDGAFGDSSALPTYLLSKLTREHVTVALCGDGGDEVFAGYERFSAALLMEQFQRLPQFAQKWVFHAISATGHLTNNRHISRLNRVMSQRKVSPEISYLGWMSFIGQDWVVRFTPGKVVSPMSDSWGIDNYRSIWNHTDSSDGTLGRLQQLNIDSYLLDDLLPKVDRMAMANALEVRSPYLDRELLEYSLALPAHLKIRGLSRKRVLREAVSDLIPDEVLNRPKRGFGVPLDRWFREDLSGFLVSKLGRTESPIRHHLEGSVLDDMIDEHMAGANHGQALWTLLTLEVFLEKEGW